MTDAKIGTMLLERTSDVSDADAQEKLRIVRADPRCLIAAPLLLELDSGSPWAFVDADVLTIWDDFGSRYIYRLGDYQPDKDAYLMEWPD